MPVDRRPGFRTGATIHADTQGLLHGGHHVLDTHRSTLCAMAPLITATQIR
jgi:hypothetical protein